MKDGLNNMMKTSCCRFKICPQKLRYWKCGSMPFLLLVLLLSDLDVSAETAKAIQVFQGHTDPVESVAFSPDGSKILSGSYDNTVKLWNAQTGTLEETFQGHTDAVMSVAFSTDGKVLSGSADNTLRQWNAETGKEVKRLSMNELNNSNDIGFLYSIAFSPEHNRAVLSGSRGNTLKLWTNIPESKGTVFFQGHEKEVYLVAISNDSKKILSASDDGTMKVWDVESKKVISDFKDEVLVWSATFSPDGSQFLMGGESIVKLFDASNNKGQEIRSFSGHSGRVYSVAFSPNGNKVLSGGHDGTINIWDTESGKETRTFKAHSDVVSSLAFSPNANQFVSASYDKTLKLWDIASSECAELCIEGLNDSYKVGDKLVVTLVEKKERSEPVDIWVAVVTPTNEMFFITSSSSEPYTFNPTPFKKSVNSSIKTHSLLNIEVLLEMVGKNYTIYVLNVEENKNPLPDGDGEKAWRSNLVSKNVRFVDVQ
jgi:WD40 repeat protein